MLQEREIFDCLKSNLKAAASEADSIAKFPQSGKAFVRMRRNLKLAEGACRQAAAFREDTRWLRPALMMEQAHQIARGWLHRPSVASKKLFVQLAGALRRMLNDLDRLETMAVGQTGIILPHHGVARAASPLTRIKNMPQLPQGILMPTR